MSAHNLLSELREAIYGNLRADEIAEAEGLLDELRARLEAAEAALNDRTAVSPLVDDRLLGARVEHVERRDDGRIVVVFGHRGTDDDSGYLIVDERDISFNDGGDPDAWERSQETRQS